MKKILNLGCGKGQNIPLLQKRGDLYCVDVSKDSIEIAKKNFPKHLYFVNAAENIIFEQKFFDEIHCYDVLEHVQDFDKVMSNIFGWLKSGGRLFVEVPYDKSEDMLIKLNPNYFKEIGHERVFEYSNIDKTFGKYNFTVKRKDTSRGVVNIYLWLIYKLGMNIDDQMATVKSKKALERFIFACCIWFDKNIFNTFLKYIPIWIFTLPVGWVMSRIFPKTVELICEKK